jgi:F-type H+-transporting ATPase subunit b
MEIVATNALISINETLIVILLSFLLFLYLMNRLMFKPLRNTMQERRDHIEGIKEEIEASKEEVVRFNRELEQQRTAVRREALKISQELEQAGGTEATEILDKTRAETIQIRSAAEEDVQIKIDAVKDQLSVQAEALAVTIMEKVLDRRLAS